MFEEILQGFPPSRQQRLRSIQRFSMLEVFFYRSSVWQHALRVAYIVNELAPIAREALPTCDLTKAVVLALVHDDAEMITGDVQLGHKLLMSQEELQKVHDAEAAAIEVLVKEFPESVVGYNYRALLREVLERKSLEAQMLTYADKLDAYCESLHEVLAGNLSALRPLFTYVKILGAFPKEYPDLQPLFANKTPFTDINMRTDPMRVRRDFYLHLNAPHTKQSLQKETDFPTYNWWRKMVLEHMGEEGLELLTKQKEFLK